MLIFAELETMTAITMTNVAVGTVTMTTINRKYTLLVDIQHLCNRINMKGRDNV